MPRYTVTVTRPGSGGVEEVYRETSDTVDGAFLRGIALIRDAQLLNLIGDAEHVAAVVDLVEVYKAQGGSISLGVDTISVEPAGEEK